MGMSIPRVLSEHPPSTVHFALVALLTLGIFIADCLTPLGIGMGSLYILVVMATMPIQNPLSTKIAIAGATALIILGYYCSINRDGYETAIFNRSISTLCVWVTGLIVLKNIKAHHALRTIKEDLEAKYGLQTQELKEQNRAMVKVLEDMERVKKDIQDNERRLQLFIDAFPSGMIIVDQLGKIVFANKLIETLFGYTQRELAGQSIDCLVPQRFQPIHAHHRTGFMDDPSTRAMGAGRDLFARRKDGSEFPVEIGLNPISTPDGLMVLSSVVDITARKESEAEMERLNRQLVSQNLELEAYNYAVSHDLRTPLRAIHNYADFLMEDCSSQVLKEHLEYLKGITTAVCEAEELVSDLLEFSRLNAQDSPVQVCDIGYIVHKVLRGLNLDKTVEVITPDEWPTIRGHEHLLRQIFQNLIYNGVKFNRSSPKRIEVLWSEEKNGFIKFSVRDNGIGIHRTYQEKIFQIFQRLHTTREYEGTGIGLAIVKKAVTKLGGEVSVESELGKGSEFSFTVPIGDHSYDT